MLIFISQILEIVVQIQIDETSKTEYEVHHYL